MKLHIAVAAALALGGFASISRADITGKVSLDGKPPEMKEIDMSGVKECSAKHPDPVTEQTVVADDKGNLANVIVAIKKEEGKDLGGEVPSQTAELDQEGCMYKPHVLAMMAGQDFIVKNQDEFLHNVHSLSTTNPPFNFGQPTKDDGKKVEPMKAAEYFRVKCDVHPWMSAYIGVFEHPFFAVSKEDGTFTIPTKGLADGEYTLTFWHEKYASDDANLPTEKITVKDGKAEAKHTFKQEAAQADQPASNVKDVVLASSTTAADENSQACPLCKMEKVTPAPTAAAKVAAAK